MKLKFIVTPGAAAIVEESESDCHPENWISLSLLSISMVAKSTGALGEGVYWMSSNQNVDPNDVISTASSWAPSVRLADSQRIQLFAFIGKFGTSEPMLLPSTKHSHEGSWGADAFTTLIIPYAFTEEPVIFIIYMQVLERVCIPWKKYEKLEFVAVPWRVLW